MPPQNEDKPTRDHDSPAVLAYRVGQLEKSSREGFKEISQKLDNMSCVFATQKDVENAQSEATMEHEAIRNELKDVEDTISTIKKEKWVQNTLSALLGAIMSLLVAYAFNGIFVK
mgnify:CR=1 FL=1